MSQSLNLFSTIQLGDVELANRAVMAPLTRSRAIDDHVPNELMAEYYAQRAGAGLIIAEATMVSEGASAFMTEPGIYSQAQIEGWRKVTDAVHEKGGKIFLQLWHGGRASHPDMNGGKLPVAASAIAIDDEVHTPDGKKPHAIPRALETTEIPSIVADFKQAAINAKEAGFDGVEVHGANGYLLDNFLRDGSNHRDDQYGGTIENRARLLFEVLEAVIDVWGSGKVGVRTSPLNSYNSMIDSDPVGITRWLAENLNQFDLAYWHLMRTDFFGIQEGEVMAPARELYKGNLMGNMGYSKEEASQAISDQHLDIISFGVPFIANPDLVERFKGDAELNDADPDYFYVGGAKGYTDYPAMA